MKTYALLALGFLSLLAPSLFGQTNTPPISEEARKHFIIGTTMAANAKTAADFSKVVSEFKQAVDLAPQLPQARYNLAKAREAAGDYSGAKADLKVYQQFKLSETEARTVQDKIYTLEAKAKLVEKDKKAQAQVATQAAQGKENNSYQDMMRSLQGEWNFASYYSPYAHSGIASPNGRGKTTITTTYDKKILITIGMFNFSGKITGHDVASIHWAVSSSGWPEASLSTAIVDKSGSHIYLKSPVPRDPSFGKPWNYDEYFEVNLTR